MESCLNITCLKECLSYPIFWLSILGLILALIVFIQIRSKIHSLCLFKDGAGTVSLSRKGLLRIVDQICLQAGSLGKSTVKLKLRNQKVDIEVRVKLPYESTAANTAIRLQNQLGTILREHLSSERIGTINILITDFEQIKTSPQTTQTN